jgi:twitching motility protein PilJ
MSVFNLFQKLFLGKATSVSEVSKTSTLELSPPSLPGTADIGVLNTIKPEEAKALNSPTALSSGGGIPVLEIGDDASPTLENADLLDIPLLGKRTVVMHQRILAALLALALLILAFVTFNNYPLRGKH